MTRQFIRISAAALAFSLTAAAPALACPASVATDVVGHNNAVSARARIGAQIGIGAIGEYNEVEAFAAGCDSRVAIVARDARTRTRVISIGEDNQIGTIVRSGGQIDGRVRGNSNEMALRAQNGGRIRAQVVGDGNYVRADVH